MERSGLRLGHFCLEVVLNRQKKKLKKMADCALQNKMKTALPNGLETSGQWAYR